MRISDIIRVTGSKTVITERAKATEVNGAVIDSRRVTPGCVFVAIRGERTDGHEYIGTALEHGAACVICEHVPDAPLDSNGEATGVCVVVEDSIKALKQIAEYHRSTLKCRIVGIIGSVGKTSTKEIVAGVLSERFRVHKTEGNFNNELGVPMTLMGIGQDTDVAVVEMGISDFGEMSRLGAMVRPDAVIMTNIGPCHLEKLHDLAGVLKAKSEVFAYVPEGGALILNGDDPMLASVSDEHHRLLWYGAHGTADVTRCLSRGLEGTEITVELDDLKNADGYIMPAGSLDTLVPLPGRHMVQNALAAALVARYLGMDTEEIARGYSKVKQVGGRGEITRSGGLLIVDDCYNANPRSMKAAIDLMHDAEGRRVAILGDMFELGEQAPVLHAEIGRYALSHGIDRLVCVGAMSHCMYEAALTECSLRSVNECDPDMSEPQTEVIYCENRERLLERLGGLGLSHGDSVLVKASHGMGFPAVVEKLKELGEQI